MDKRMRWLVEEKIAHRGYHNSQYPENSMGAFKRAMEHGYGIELDIHILKDGNVIVFHDDNLKRLTGVDKDIAKCTYGEIKDLKLYDTEERIPLLKDVLAEVNGKFGIMVELKNSVKVGRLEEKTYALLKNYKGDFIVQSFSPFSVAWFKKNAPEFARGQLAGSFKGEQVAWYKKILLRNFMLNGMSKPDFVNYDVRYLDRFIIKLLKRRGKVIFGWTARSQKEYDAALKTCINAVFEDFTPTKVS